ncbi:conserved hypothetical protein [Aspergillus terreus NIH2624]|uniref:NADP-dependent oxidoreductase domain-containing protein n=1 Tax=Aspergillus terreus (strain NIH 2624 / FGSC A1156) TaxID=341663 RepID=Q0CV71_ASPTN|nr:uncharacterized protein ATEG_02413 [Aspergillus terreus NIH2624]EAU37375.1 conserved hypothetical protein [Aspergillus terreus NIH2624]
MTANKAVAAHVNMMADTIIANLPVDGLRTVVRGILTSKSDMVAVLEEQTKEYLRETAARFSNAVVIEQLPDGSFKTTSLFDELQQRIRCSIGCGMCYQTLPLLQAIVDQAAPITLRPDQTQPYRDTFLSKVASVDADIVQAMTAVQKTLFVAEGTRDLTDAERQPMEALLRSLVDCRAKWEGKQQTFVFERGLDAVNGILNPAAADEATTKLPESLSEPPRSIGETFELAEGVRLPRIFNGLWQLSSPSWGAASRPKILEQLSHYVSNGLIAFDMADHYGDAEIVFGRYRSSSKYSQSMFAATKYCVFHPMTVTREAVRANVSERCQRLRTEKLDLLQFHWQFYEDPQYIDALRYLQEDDRVQHLGLCNFDTEHMQNVIESGVQIVTNQVQFSLIDSRPVMRMVEFCEKNNVKLLTYGTLCGGLIAEKWIGQDAPDLYGEKMTPSLRKYYAMIQSWGGWDLFQELLRTLQSIGRKHGVSVSNVATRWVLDFPCVGAVIVGARMGVSEQLQGNLDSLGWTLDEADRTAIEEILVRSRRMEMFESMGDCGGEYRL